MAFGGPDTCSAQHLEDFEYSSWMLKLEEHKKAWALSNMQTHTYLQNESLVGNLA